MKWNQCGRIVFYFLLHFQGEIFFKVNEISFTTIGVIIFTDNVKSRFILKILV